MISAVILTKNEEKNILDCLESVFWADEIVVVDDNSQDRTIDVIKNYSAKVKIFKNNLNGDFSAQRNFALSKTTKDWVLFADTDERISNNLREEINTVLIDEKNSPKNKGFYIPRRDIMWGRILKHGETGSIKLLRLAKRDAGVWQGKVHEEWIIDGKVGKLEEQIVHYPHQTVNEFLKEINFYTTLRAKELYGKKTKVELKDIVVYPIGKFFVNYFLKFGFLDGIEGLIVSILMSFHSYLVRAKLWSYYKKY
jgi:glycosyltransferase involved in cell wall biosynthesis